MTGLNVVIAATTRSQQQLDDCRCIGPGHGRTIPAHETGKPGVCGESGERQMPLLWIQQRRVMAR